MLIRRDILNGLKGLAVTPLFMRGMAAEATTLANGGLILVVINLAGGNDGLNTVIPLSQFKAYTTLRRPAAPPTVDLTLNYTLSQFQQAGTVFDSNFVTPSLSASEYAFAPGMTAMRQLYAAGKLAVLNGISLPLAELASLSHSNASSDWQTGQINTTLATPPGWLAQALSGQTATGSLGLNASLSGGWQTLVYDGTTQPLVMAPSIDNFNFSYGTSDNSSMLTYNFKKMMALPETNSATLFGQTALQNTASAVVTVDALAKKEKIADYPAISTWIDDQLHDVARLILGQSGLRGFYVEHDGFDTHGQQALYQPLLLTQLSNAMFNFYTYLKSKSASSNVVIATISDFGRRPGANLTFGTDHGAASTAFVLGDPVTGGVYGNYPSLTKFDINGNLNLTIDFRNMLSDLITAMGGNAATILGKTYPKIGFI
jgi:uncharacterized protein (DUF1501 family)